MQARRPRFKDESGALVSPAEVRRTPFQRRLDQEVKIAAWIGLPAFFCLVFFEGHIMGRTLDADDLRYLLFRVGAIAGLALGVWRTLLLTKVSRQQGEPAGLARPSNWNRKHQFWFVFIYMLIGTLLMRSTGALLNRFAHASQIKAERAVVARMPSSRGKGASYWLELQMTERVDALRIGVSISEYSRFRVLDLVEVHTRRGVLGYDYVTDIVKVGSQRVSQ